VNHVQFDIGSERLTEVTKRGRNSRRKRRARHSFTRMLRKRAATMSCPHGTKECFVCLMNSLTSKEIEKLL